MAQPVRAVEAATGNRIALPRVNVVTQGLRAGSEQFRAALGVEFRLLRAERSLVVVAPLVVFMCGLELAAYKVVPEVSYSAAYAGRTANALLFFLFGVAVFYAGEAMHRDRELRVEPVLWSTPAPDFVLLLSKFAATLLLSVSLMTLVAAAAVGLQLYKGDAPLELRPYLTAYALILVPSAVFMIAASVALNVLLRDKYLTYAVALGLGGAFYYLAGQGYNGWLYNPTLYTLWTPADLAGGSHLARILTQRVYSLALSVFILTSAFLFFGRKSSGGLKARRRLAGKGWAILLAAASALAAVVTGLIVSRAG